ncbi:MAG: hypothetical protein NC092_03260 [Butyrivibrio sp.]|nr:hypothetical protein [Muribaculum sp.]MCM1551692.1 hypothetical protein [Butyrivibrio sp.]
MLIIRADGNAKIGAGHLMRCLTIGEAARELNQEVLFLCADEDSARLARSHGFRAGVLHTDYRQMESELAVWDSWVQGGGNTILVDSYHVTDAYLTGLRKYGTVYLMDDMQRRAYPVDGVINYNLYADSEVYRKIYGTDPYIPQNKFENKFSNSLLEAVSQAEACDMQGYNYDKDGRFYLGSSYVPLREQFREVEYHVRESVSDVLITTGGADADNIAGRLLECIERQEITYHVLVGRFSPHFESWQARAEESPHIRIYFDLQDMAGLMQRCDLAVSAGGSTLYELAAVGVPFICFSYAENQEVLAEYMGEKAVAGYAGAWHLDRLGTLGRLTALFSKLCGDRALREQYSKRERELIDGQGAYRLAEVLCGLR